MERAFIVFQWLGGLGFKKLAKVWESNPKTIKVLCRKYEETGDVFDEPRSGRPRCTSIREDRILHRKALANSFNNASKIAREDGPYLEKKSISHQTVGRRLNEINLNASIAARKPLLRSYNITKRLEWAKVHKDWTKEKWRRVIFSDESPFCIFQDGGRIWIWRFRDERYLPKNLVPTVKHGGGKIQIWGCFNYSLKGPLKLIDGKLTGEKYTMILKHTMAPFLKDVEEEIGEKAIFQQDNDPKHTSKKAKKYLGNKDVDVLDWPSQSPDLNPIEHLWRQLKLAIYKRKVKASDKSDLWTIIQEEWEQFPMENLHRLVDSMPDRIDAVIKAKGHHTKY
jgi:hypothetical protein